MLLVGSSDFFIKIARKSDAVGKQSMNRLDDAYLRARPDQRDARSRAGEELTPSRSHGRGNSRLGTVCSPLPAVVLKRFYFRSLLSPPWFREWPWQNEIRGETFVPFKTSSFYERWTRSSRSTMLPLGQSQKPVALSLFLSSRLPPSLQLSRTAADTYVVPFSARVHRVSISRDLYSRKITAPWAPLLPDRPWITRSKSIRNTIFPWALFRLVFAVLHAGDFNRFILKN